MSSSRRVGHQGSATAVIELEPIQSLPRAPEKHFPVDSGRRLGQNDLDDNSERHDQNETLPSPTVASHETLERWNAPRSNLYRTLAAFIGFAIMGMNDATYGPIIPSLEQYYGLSYTVVSLIFLSPFVGFNIAALLNNQIHMRFGQRGIAMIGPACRVIAYLVSSLHPPYPVLVISYILAGFGNGVTSWPLRAA